MKLNESNIEAYLLDYMEGRLSKEAAFQVENFLKKNPEYAAMAADFDGFSLKDLAIEKPVKCPYKDSLKHTSEFDFSGESYFLRLAVSVLEGVAEEGEILEYQKIIYEHPEKRTDAFLFSKCRLEPDRNVVFDDKKSLKHLFFIPWKKIAAAAAVLLPVAFLMLFFAEEPVKISGVYFSSHEVFMREPYAEKNVAVAKQQTARTIPVIKKRKTMIFSEKDSSLPEKNVEEEFVVFRKVPDLQVEISSEVEELKNPVSKENFVSEETVFEDKPKTNFIGGKLFRFAKKINIEVSRGEDGSFTALNVITPDKTYSIRRVN
jgi:hypothetical protein